MQPITSLHKERMYCADYKILYHVKRVQFEGTASTSTEFLPLAHNTHFRGVKWRSRGRRVKREPSVKSSVLSNGSYFKRNLVMANQLYSCQTERIASLSEKEKNIYQIVTI